MSTDESTRGRWSGRIGFILAAIGSAVGLGNIWRFPYLVGTGGGAGFIAVYFLAALLIGFAICIAEIYIGQKSQSNVINAFTNLIHKKRSLWQIVGVIAILATSLILSFYCVIGGWVLDFEFRSITDQFSGQTPDAIKVLFTNLLDSPCRMIFWHFIYCVINTVIVMAGVEKGIERCSLWLMPALFFMLVGLVFGALCRSMDLLKG